MDSLVFLALALAVASSFLTLVMFFSVRGWLQRIHRVTAAASDLNLEALEKLRITLERRP